MASIAFRENFEVGVFLERVNRFTVRVRLLDEDVLAHLPNSGRLNTVLMPGSVAFLIPKNKPDRKTRFDLFAVERDKIPIIVDTRFSSFAARKTVEWEMHERLRGFKVVKENVAVNNSRLDMLLQSGTRQFFLEVKSVTHVINGVALFPDAPTQRGRKHLRHLMELREQGRQTGVLFSVQRPDAKALQPNREVDPEFAMLLRKAVNEGLQVFSQTLLFRYGAHPSVKIKVDVPMFRFL
ncbi:MAG: DNA/RNA nuclease SfsA [Candidatus Bathyarchaeia archaeon]|jgi:sugar fermentation stimulation protein A|nr:DNA/RNA nuclease SfsA [Candidatus Bathyarchaeota archaeon A05DMB-4]MDH7595717.1 DNA/RNA nuclease SfsA [Candidatus Bathyarchaeota archaeon]